VDELHECDRCGQSLPRYGFYIAKIDVYADPALPPMSEDDLARANPGDAMKEIYQALRDRGPDELMDDVHRHFDFKLCRRCQRAFIFNPLGQPGHE
jgi:hypothetical protein